MLTAVAPSVGAVNVAVRLAACAIRGTAIAASAISKTIEVSRRDGVFMTPHLSNLRSIDSLTNVVPKINGLRGNSGSGRWFSRMRRAKVGCRHDLCEHTSLAICFQLEVLQSVTILKCWLAANRSDLLTRKRGARALAPAGTLHVLAHSNSIMSA